MIDTVNERREFEPVNPEIRSKLEELLPRIARLLGDRGVVAGGAVRDCYFGLVPKDIDIFIDTTGMENPEDEVLLIADEIVQGLPEIEVKTIFDWEEPRGYDKEQSRLKESDWVLYGSDQIPMGVPGLFWEGTTSIQFIGRKFSSREELVSSFDYSLVRCWVDHEMPRYSTDFADALIDKTIRSRDANTTRRINSFLNRLPRSLSSIINVEETYRRQTQLVEKALSMKPKPKQYGQPWLRTFDGRF